MQLRWTWTATWALAACSVAGLALAAEAPPTARPPPPPPEDFFLAPALEAAKLSPSGRWMAALFTEPGRRTSLQITDLEGDEPQRRIEASDVDDVASFRWVDDEWLVFTLGEAVRVRDLYRGRGLLSVRRDGSNIRLLIDRGTQSGSTRVQSYNHFLLALGPPGSHTVVLGEAHWDQRDQFTRTSLKQVDVRTGRYTRLAEDGPRAANWHFDAQGRPRVATQHSEGRVTTWWADTEGRWRKLNEAPVLERPFTPAYVEGEETLVVYAHDAQGQLGLYRFDFASGKPQAEPLFSTPGFDSDVSAVREHGSGRVHGLHATAESTTTTWFSPAMRAAQAQAEQRYPGARHVLQCDDCSKPRTVLVYSYSDTDPGRYRLYRPQRNEWLLLGAARPGLDTQRLGRMSFHRTAARDGHVLPLWVTRPPQAQPGPAPAIVLVHGGPHERGATWSFDPEVQFLASRGYVVVQPEFRGSTGYGSAHYRAGWKQWGLAMQDDVADALKFAVDQGWVDASRVCIMGASYGGYSALMGLVKDPGLYRCGVAFAAVSDPRFTYDFHWSDTTSDNRRYYMPDMVGDRQADAARLAAGSAVDQAARIRAPLLLAHGALDYRVPLDHALRMRDALRQHGKAFDWVVYDQEGHGFVDDRNRLDYYRRVEAFLARHLAP